jgi:type II secretory pathway component GspD/PulD (secretin)
MSHRRACLSLWVLVAALALPNPLATADANPEGKAPEKKNVKDEPKSVQVRVEARIFEWQMSNGLDFDFAVRYQRDSGSGGILDSIDLTLPADPSLGSAARLFLNELDAANGSFDIVIEALETAGEVESLAEPSIVLSSRQAPLESLLGRRVELYKDKAKGVLIDGAGHVHNTQEIPFETAQATGNRLVSYTDYQDAGLTLDVVVQHVTAEGLVILDLNTRVKDLAGFIRVGLNERNDPMRVPAFETREIENRLIVPDGTVFLAGLMKTTRQIDRSRGIPYISELPLLRWTSSSRSNRSADSELVFLIKPEVLSPRSTLAELAAAEDGGEGETP